MRLILNLMPINFLFAVSLQRSLDLLEIRSEIPESGTVYDYCWFKGEGDPR